MQGSHFRVFLTSLNSQWFTRGEGQGGSQASTPQEEGQPNGRECSLGQSPDHNSYTFHHRENARKPFDGLVSCSCYLKVPHSGLG